MDIANRLKVAPDDAVIRVLDKAKLVPQPMPEVVQLVQVLALAINSNGSPWMPRVVNCVALSDDELEVTLTYVLRPRVKKSKLILPEKAAETRVITFNITQDEIDGPRMDLLQRMHDLVEAGLVMEDES